MRTKESATVLIVDDDPIIRKIVAEQIALFGFQPILAASGEEAVAAAESIGYPDQNTIHVRLYLSVNGSLRDPG